MSDKSNRKTRILWAGKRRADIPSFVPNLESRGYKVTFVSTGKDAIQKLNQRDHVSANPSRQNIAPSPSS